MRQFLRYLWLFPALAWLGGQDIEPWSLDRVLILWGLLAAVLIRLGIDEGWIE